MSAKKRPTSRRFNKSRAPRFSAQLDAKKHVQVRDERDGTIYYILCGPSDFGLRFLASIRAKKVTVL